MYLFNLLFDLTPGAHDKEDGLFTSDTGANALDNSRRWLHLLPDGQHADNPVGLDVETARWELAGGSHDGHLLLSKGSNPGHICVRIAPSTPIDPNATLSISVLYGRQALAHQRHTSPHTFNDLPGGRTLTVFNLPDGPRNSGPGWFFALKPLSRAPGAGDRNVVHRYEFVVGARLNNLGDIYTFAEDPEMDVSF